MDAMDKDSPSSGSDGDESTEVGCFDGLGGSSDIGVGRIDTVDDILKPERCCDALCNPRVLCFAFLREFKRHEQRLSLFRSTEANADWPFIFGTSAWCGAGEDSNTYLLVWRVACAIIFVGHLGYSMIDDFKDGYWFIYLTHWSLIVETAYFLFGVATVFAARPYCQGRKEAQGDPLPWFVRIFWILMHIAMPASFLVALLFWSILCPIWICSGQSYLSVFMHGLNFIVMTCDLLIARNVFYLQYTLWFIAYGFLYFAWSLVHFWARIGTYKPCTTWTSGTCNVDVDCSGSAEMCYDGHCYVEKYPQDECPIYGVLDWHKATFTMALFAALLFIVVPLMQYMLWWCVFRRRTLGYYIQKDRENSFSGSE